MLKRRVLFYDTDLETQRKSVFSAEEVPERKINYTVQILAETTNCCYSLCIPNVL